MDEREVVIEYQGIAWFKLQDRQIVEAHVLVDALRAQLAATEPA